MEAYLFMGGKKCDTSESYFKFGLNSGLFFFFRKLLNEFEL